MVVQGRDSVISFSPKYFSVCSPDESFLGVVGTNGIRLCYKTNDFSLEKIFDKFLCDMNSGLYVRVDNSDFFLLSSLKTVIDSLRVDGYVRFVTSDILSRAGVLETVVEEEFGGRNVK